MHTVLLILSAVLLEVIIDPVPVCHILGVLGQDSSIFSTFSAILHPHKAHVPSTLNGQVLHKASLALAIDVVIFILSKIWKYYSWPITKII